MSTALKSTDQAADDFDWLGSPAPVAPPVAPMSGFDAFMANPENVARMRKQQAREMRLSSMEDFINEKGLMADFDAWLEEGQ